MVVARGLCGLIDGLGGVGQALLAASLTVVGGLPAVRRLRLACGAPAARLSLERDRVLGKSQREVSRDLCCRRRADQYVWGRTEATNSCGLGRRLLLRGDSRTGEPAAHACTAESCSRHAHTPARNPACRCHRPLQAPGLSRQPLRHPPPCQSSQTAHGGLRPNRTLGWSLRASAGTWRKPRRDSCAPTRALNEVSPAEVLISVSNQSPAGGAGGRGNARCTEKPQ